MLTPDLNSKLREEASSPNPTPVYVVPPGGSPDHIGLVDLWGLVLRRKWIPVVSILISVALFGLYILLVEPVYRAESHLLPPSHQVIQELLIDFTDVEVEDKKSYTPEIVYAEFLKNLKSLGLRRKFFDSNNLIEHYVKNLPESKVNPDRIFDTRFNKALQVRVDKQDPSFVTTSFDLSSPELAAQWLKQYVEYTNAWTINQLFVDVNTAISAEVDKVHYQLGSKLKLAEQRRQDTITTLKEALRVASTLGVDDASTFPRMVDRAQSGLAVNTAQVPLYMRGVNALKTEIDVLEARKSDEPFIAGYRDLQERRAYLEGILVDVDKLSAVTIDLPAKVPYRAQSPRVVSLLVMAVVLGGIVGIFIIFIAELSKASRR